MYPRSRRASAGRSDMMASALHYRRCKMHNRDYIDLGRLLDQIFQATEEFTKSFGPFSFDQKSKAEHRNYYSIYPFPPANIYMLQDKTMVFEFALAGYRDTDISLEFLGDNMVLSARAPETATDTD